MADLIDREELLKKINCEGSANGYRFTKQQLIESMNGMRDYIIDIIKQQPKVETERHGHWIKNTISSGQDSWTCSQCGRRARGKKENLPYCHCGCKNE